MIERDSRASTTAGTGSPTAPTAPGDRVLILIHGLLMNGSMFARLAPEMAARGNRVVCVDLLGHGAQRRARATSTSTR